MTEPAPAVGEGAPPAPPRPRSRIRRGARRVGWFTVAFVAMLAIAAGSMIRFTGNSESDSRGETVVKDVIARANAPRAITPTGLTLPVAGVKLAALTDTWGQSRAGGARTHQGIDIMASGGAPVVAAAAGTIEKVFDSAAGGHTLYVRSPDRRWMYYYAHLAAYAPAVREGAKVAAGQQIAFVGDTGNAGPGNYHLHFGISRMRVGDRWWQGEPLNPYPLLVGSGTAR
ncbi:M23 family metallopeptidase [Sphingomonas donggukensis]|uniref:M23 family metallopeptidase n=1 Tax=Sphingomonas donggukensis TaxID=2949093 RepID=A0ABY4U1Y4_9SPHN|nr:M23 family metallopeptidase [Sphingomonas donggukensis]URW76558.1 M23 family metallopeptidase [Sphingomonas donggukensis]